MWKKKNYFRLLSTQKAKGTAPHRLMGLTSPDKQEGCLGGNIPAVSCSILRGQDAAVSSASGSLPKPLPWQVQLWQGGKLSAQIVALKALFPLDHSDVSHH